MAAIAGYLSDLYMASGAGVTFTTEAMTDSGDHTIYTAGTAAHRYWDDTSALTIEVSTDGGSTWGAPTAGTYSVQYVGGVVTFTTADPTRSVRASGKYLAISQIGQAYDWELTPTADVLDVTTFSSNGWKEKIVGLHDATGKASSYFLDGTFFGLLGQRLVIVFYPKFSTGERFEGFAFLKSDPMKMAVDAVISEELDFEIDGTLYYLAS
jgi:hypothetical protein